MSTPPKLVHVAILLAIVLVSSACGVSTAANAPTSTPTPPPTYTPYPVPTLPPAPTSTPVPEWVTRIGGLDSASRTYQIDIPGVLTCGASSSPSGHSILPCHDDDVQYPLPPDHPVVAELNISLEAAWVADQTPYCRHGTRITVGPGIAGYQNDGFSTPPASSDCQYSGSLIIAFWIASGVCYQLEMDGQASADTFMSRYGAIWRHILASFVPPPAPAAGETTCS